MIDILTANNEILILMATFNGAKFIQEQVESIQNQTLTRWTLVIRDDGSTDETITLLKDYIEKDKRIYLLKDSLGATGSAQGNFCCLLDFAQKTSSEYIFFSDQDDVWLSNKLESFISEAKRLSACNSSPLLVHSDLRIVDQNLKLIAPSFVSSVRLSPLKNNTVKSFAFQNSVTGCACMINRALLNKVTPAPKSVLMHDWWLALVASSVGTITFMPEVTVKYRQHTGNAVGAISYLTLCNPFSNLSWNMIREGRKFIEGSYLQIVNLRERLLVGGYDTSEADILLASARLNRFHRIVYLKKHGFLPVDKGRITGFIIRHLLTPRSDIKKYAR
ncbi:glycosyltransferase-like protein [Shewanella sediminis HAW-EB3]|uniref:Glycosyltransferase-like protein n=1 Tax=Shewanella sediminis (strain HAW-EB3) TaxID=425104 RepID=A8FXM6_SHESH|nr:glycosyltransferase family 2 protein [Shewanella sediminis]ABV37599.1 glycosyltransferase-like protein [Shewanella sediminis HAW-EB3]